MELASLKKLEARFLNAGDTVCAIDGSGEPPYPTISYRQLRMRSAALARALNDRGIGRDGWCAADMDTCPAFLYLVFAAAIGGFTIVALNVRLTQQEKEDRVADVRRSEHVASIDILGEQDVLDAIGLPASDPASLSGADEATLANWTRRGIGAFDTKMRAVVMFTSGTSGRPKAAALTWDNLMDAARASNASLNTPGEGLWQLGLPMYHVGGMEIVWRSVLNGNPFILYRRFEADRILRDAETYTATHVSVVDKTLRDLLDADGAAELAADGGADEAPSPTRVLPRYECVLLGGSAPNAATLQRAVACGVKVRASYGMTETCSHIASCPVTADFDGALAPLPGYDVSVLAPDESGVGQLAVKGPGVFSGYLNAQAAFTADGYFLTGDSARMQGRYVVVAERTDDMFVSGGENIYPEEIRGKLLQVPGVTEAYVFGVEDREWGRRPVAFVEASKDALTGDFNAQEMAERVQLSLSARIAHIYTPDHIAVVPEFPRTGIGKIDRTTLQLFYSERLEVKRVELWRIKQDIRGIRTAKTHLKTRESLIVRLTEYAGRTGVGEDVAFSTAWYLPETIDDDLPFIENVLAPLVLKHIFMHPKQVYALFARQPLAAEHPLACAAMESALWDLYGKVMGLSVVRLIGGRASVSEAGAVHPVPAGCVPGGAVISTGSVSDVVAAASEAVEAGYARVKLKVKPGHDVKQVRAVREHFPDLTIMLDANQSYNEDDLPALQQLDVLNIACLEEPLDPKRLPAVGPQDLFSRLARLQNELSMPICLDESWTNVEDLKVILEAHPPLRCVALKLGKFGGVQPALDFYAYARNRGIMLWVGGMYDTGVSKRLGAAFSTLPGINLPGDISDTARYFERDITVPPFALGGGVLRVNPEGHEAGIGCDVDEDVLDALAVQKWEWE